jgi:hypothetical protein
MHTKQCSKCEQELVLPEFNRSSTAKDGRRSDCRECERKARAARARAKGIKPAKKGRLVRDKEYRRAERRRAAEKIGKEYRSREEMKRRSDVVREEKKALKRIALNVKRAKARKARGPLNLSDAERWKYRYRTDPEFNLKERIRNQLKKKKRTEKYASLIRASINRVGSSPTIAKLFGYSIRDLKQHIESLFSDGMTWKAFMRGEIHIDHVKPIAAHDLSKHDELVDCWSLSNLQPLWVKDNLAKSAKWNEPA